MAAVSRVIEIEAEPEEIWEALVSDEDRRAGWLGRSPSARSADRGGTGARTPRLALGRDGEQPPTRVEIRSSRLPGGSRVVVTESVPSFPLPALAARFAAVAA